MKKNYLAARLHAVRRSAENKEAFISQQKSVLDAKGFFTENDPENGITSKVLFANHVGLLNSDELLELDVFVNVLTERKPITFRGQARIDKQNRPYYWAEVKNGSISQGIKILYFDGLDKLIRTNGQFTIRLSLEELFEELEEVTAVED